MKKGFTLIKVMVVVCIIAFLAAITVHPFLKSREESRNHRKAAIEERISVSAPVQPVELEKAEKTPEQIEQEKERAKDLERKMNIRIAEISEQNRLGRERNKLEQERKNCNLTRLCEVDGYTIYSVYDMSGGGTKVFAIPKK